MNIASKEVHFMGFVMELNEGGEPPEPEEAPREHIVFEESKLLPPKIIEEEHQEFSAEFV